MNKLLQLTITSLLVSSASLPLSLQAAAPSATFDPNLLIQVDNDDEDENGEEEHAPTLKTDSKATEAPKGKTATPDKKAESKPTKHDKPFKGFIVQHHIGNQPPAPKETVAGDPLALWGNLKTTLEKQTKPVQIHTEINVLVPDDITKTLGQLPALTIMTNVDAAGKGKSDVTLPTFQKDIPAQGGHSAGKFDWKGLTGQLTFSDKFQNLTAAFNLAGWTMSAEKEFDFVLGKTTFNAEFDTDMMPMKADFSLPMLNLSTPKNTVELQSITMNMKVDKASNGVELSNGTFKVAHFGVSEKNEKIVVDDSALTVSSSLKEDALNYALQSQIGKLIVPASITKSEALELTYISNLEFRHLDAASILELQKSVREMQKQRQTGGVSEEMMGMMFLGKLMEVGPKLLAKTPEIALSQFQVKTKDGELQGKTTITINFGKNPVSFNTPALLAAVKADAEFTISKTLLEKIGTTVEQDKLQSRSKDGKPVDKAELQKQAKASAEQKIKGMLEQKFLVDAGNNYKIVAKFEGSKLTVNGKDIPLPGQPAPSK